MNNKKLQTLIEEYKTTEDKDVLTSIFVLLEDLIHKKAEYIYHTQVFNYMGKTIRLKQTNLTTFEDVKQDLYLCVLEIIQSYDKNLGLFGAYLLVSIWNKRPTFIKKFGKGAKVVGRTLGGLGAAAVYLTAKKTAKVVRGRRRTVRRATRRYARPTRRRVARRTTRRTTKKATPLGIGSLLPGYKGSLY